jgi:hypothetical protein
VRVALSSEVTSSVTGVLQKILGWHRICLISSLICLWSFFFQPKPGEKPIPGMKSDLKLTPCVEFRPLLIELFDGNKLVYST